jgi:hypothetical protein
MTAAPEKHAQKEVPPLNSKFYQLVEHLTPDKRATVKKFARTCGTLRGSSRSPSASRSTLTPAPT